MGRAILTGLAVERAHRSGDRLLLSDGDGLYLRKQTRDGASWTLRYRFANREHWLTLGHYPDMSLAEARIEARRARVLLDKQQDPLSVRRAAKAEQRQRGSFRDLCEEWYRYEITGRGLEHPDVPRRHLDKYLLPKLGRTAAADVTPANIARAIDARRRDRRERVPHVGRDTLNAALQRVKHGLRTFTLHDLRRTARTQLAALGVRREVAERCLGHAIHGVEGIYDRHDYFKERRAALERWTGLLIDAERGVRKVAAISQRSQERAAG